MRANKYVTLSLQAMPHGGFIVFEIPSFEGHLREPLAAFTALNDALNWMRRRMLQNAPDADKASS